MSDVVAVALITAGSTLIATGIGARMNYLSTKRNAETAVQNANRHAEVELEKVRAETKRQLDEYREEERRNRQGTYHRLLAAFDRLELWTHNPRGLGKQYEAHLSEIQLLSAGCSLFGAEAVTDALRPIVSMLADIESEPARPSDEGQDRIRRGYRERRDQVIEAQRKLVDAMRADVTSIHD